MSEMSQENQSTSQADTEKQEELKQRKRRKIPEPYLSRAKLAMKRLDELEKRIAVLKSRTALFQREMKSCLARTEKLESYFTIIDPKRCFKD